MDGEDSYDRSDGNDGDNGCDNGGDSDAIVSEGDVANLPEAAIACAKKGNGEVSSAGGGDAGEEGGEGEDRGGGDGQLPAQGRVNVQTTELLP